MRRRNPTSGAISPFCCRIVVGFPGASAGHPYCSGLHLDAICLLGFMALLLLVLWCSISSGGLRYQLVNYARVYDYGDIALPRCHYSGANPPDRFKDDWPFGYMGGVLNVDSRIAVGATIGKRAQRWLDLGFFFAFSHRVKGEAGSALVVAFTWQNDLCHRVGKNVYGSVNDPPFRVTYLVNTPDLGTAI